MRLNTLRWSKPGKTGRSLIFFVSFLALLLVAAVTLPGTRPAFATGLPCGVWGHGSWTEGTVTWSTNSNGEIVPSITDAIETLVWTDPCANTTQPNDQETVPYTYEDLQTVEENGVWKYVVTYKAYSTVSGGPTLTTVDEYTAGLEPPGPPTFSNVGQTSLTATMPDLPAGATSLKLQQKLASEFSTAYVTIATGQLAFDPVSVTGLTASTDYTFRCIAVYPTGVAVGPGAGVTTSTAPPDAPGAPTFSDITTDSVTVTAPALPQYAQYMKLQAKWYGQDDSSYVQVETNLAGGAISPVSGLNSGTTYVFRYVAIGAGGSTPGTPGDVTMLVPVVTWSAGANISCDGIRWPGTGATLAASSEGRVSAFLATDWDERQVSVGQTVISLRDHSDPCSYTWSAVDGNGDPVGSFKNGINKGQSVVWIAPSTPGTYTLRLVVDDQNALNMATGDTGTRGDAAYGYNDDPVDFSVDITVQ